MTKPVHNVNVDEVDAKAFGALLPAAAHLYGMAMDRAPELVVQRREIMQGHLGRDGFVAITATAGDVLVGFCYGYRGRPGEWWHDVVAAALARASDGGRKFARRWLDNAFELAELHVHPDWQGRGVGRRLLNLLLEEAVGDTVVLSTHDRESAARALYRSVGFVDLLQNFEFPGSAEVYAIMGLQR